MILSTYLIGLTVAAFLIGRLLTEREEEGGVICYMFALLSWVTVLIIVIARKFDRL